MMINSCNTFTRRTMFVVLFFVLFTNTGCPRSAPEGTQAPEPTASRSGVPAGTSFEETEVIEPMFPEIPEETLEETPEEQSEEVQAAPLEEPSASFSRALPPYAAQAGAAKVKLPPIGDLEPQIEKYVTKLEKNLGDIIENGGRFSDEADTLHRDASTLATIALAVGLSEEDCKLKPATPALLAAAMNMEQAKTAEQAKAAMAELKKAMTTKGDPTKLRWGKVASLKPLMKALPTINTLMKRNMRSEAIIKRGSKNVLEGSAALAVIAQASLPNVDETIKPQAAKEWEQLWSTFREGAMSINTKTRQYLDGKIEFERLEEAYDDYYESCNDCHKAFFDGEIEIE